MAVTVSARREITGIIRRALASAQESGALPQTEVDDLSVERPQNPENGDFSCSLAMKLARPIRMNPRAIGQALIDHMGNMADDAMSESASALAGGLIGSLVGRVWLAGPGFVNFSLSESWLRSQVDAIIERWRQVRRFRRGRRLQSPGGVRQRESDGPRSCRPRSWSRARQRARQHPISRRMPRSARILCERRRYADGAVLRDCVRALSPGIVHIR